MARRANTYETKSDEDSLEELSKTLTDDLRQSIRGLGSAKPLTEKWCAMASSFERIASVAEMEEKLPKESSGSTLWECEELALRYLLEDGKMNLCLRLMDQWKEFQREQGDADQTPNAAAAQKFERGCGLTLHHAWKHIEAVQTTDLPLMVDHIVRVLNHAAERPDGCVQGSIGEMQEALVLHYLHSLVDKMEEMEESRFMQHVRKKGVVPSMVAHLTINCSRLRPADRVAGFTALALIFNSEDYSTFPDEYLRSDEDLLALIELADPVQEIADEEYEFKKALRPLTDMIRKSKRRLDK